MDTTLEHTVMGLSPELAHGLSLLLFVFAALMFMLVAFAHVKRQAKNLPAMPGPAIVLLMIGIASFVGALVLKLS